MSAEAWELTPDRLQAILELDGDLFVVLDPGLLILYADPSARTVLGYRAAELIGAPCLSLVYPEDVPGVETVLRSLLLEPGAKTRTGFKIRHKDGSWRFVDAAVMHHRDRAGTFLFVRAADVTERTRLEARVRAAQRMEAVGQLAGGVAHDFNNLLTAILGNVELLLLDLPSGDPRREDVEEIRHAGERAATLTRQLLAFSGRRTLQLRSVAASDLVVKTQRLLERVIGEDIALTVEVTDEDCCMRVDPAQLEQVLVNLATNARDAMPAGGRLSFEVGVTALRSEEREVPYFVRPGEYVSIAVRDTGTGMTPDVQARIFDPFFTTKPPEKGTGLGLSTAYGIVKQIGGYLWAESVPEVGTVFHLLVPRHGGPPDEETPRPEVEISVSRGRVFFVEDDPRVRRVAVRALELGGFEVSAFGNPAEALAAFAVVSSHVDLLITDVVMPGMSGPELATRMTAIRPDLPVLFLSGYSGEVLGGYGVASSALNVLAKPVTASQLISAAGALLSDDPARVRAHGENGTV